MVEVIELIGDLENLPEWAQEAFEAGTLIRTCVEKVERLEERLKNSQSDFLTIHRDSGRKDRVTETLTAALRNLHTIAQMVYNEKADQSDSRLAKALIYASELLDGEGEK